MLEVRSIQTFYGNIQALKKVSLSIEEGEAWIRGALRAIGAPLASTAMFGPPLATVGADSGWIGPTVPSGLIWANSAREMPFS